MTQTRLSKCAVLPWLGWFIACCAGLYQFLLQTSTSVMISGLETTFSLNSLGVSLLSSSFFYTYLLCQIPAGMLVDYFKPRRMMVVCQLLLAVFCYSFANSPNVWMAVVSRILMGIVCAPTFITAFYLIAHTLPEKYFPLIAGFTETMAMLGGVAGEALLARSVMSYGWQHTVIILSCVAIVMSFLSGVFIRDFSLLKTTTPVVRERGQVWKDLVTMLCDSQAWINGLFCGLLFGVIAAFGGFWCIPYLMQLYHVSLGGAADASSMIFIGAALGTPIIAWCADRFDARRLLMLLCSLLGIVTFMMILFWPPKTIAGMFILIALMGFFSGSYVIPFSIIRDITPQNMRGTAMGYINMMCILIGSPVLQPVIGFILHQHDVVTLAAYQQAFLAFPVCLLIAFGLAAFVRES